MNPHLSLHITNKTSTLIGVVFMNLFHNYFSIYHCIHLTVVYSLQVTVICTGFLFFFLENVSHQIQHIYETMWNIYKL